MRGATRFIDDTQRRRLVSIHAPMRGATSDSTGSLREVSVSIHAPMRGATFLPPQCFFRTAVSIHAPMRGATSSSAVGAAASTSFNPRAHAGRDLVQQVV